MLLQVKRFSEKLLTPLGKKLVKIPANYITLLGLISASIVFCGFVFHFLIMTITFLFLTEFFDQLDGIIARFQGSTKLGAFLDSTLDRIGDVLIFLGVIFGAFISIEIGLTVLIGAFLTSYTRAKIEALGFKNLYGIGLLERTDRIPILFIGTLFQIWFPKALWWTMIFLAIGTIFTTLQRIIFAYQKFYKMNKKS